jgi:A/G-specific adenine glycosylase
MGEYVSVDTIMDELRKRVIEWERRNWMPYPWRVNRTPYNVLVAEILLKRTTRQAVAREDPEFIRKFLDIYAIHRASVEEVASALKHLGLYKQRAEQLKKLAKALVEKHGGRIPDDWEALAELPGFESYVAGGRPQLRLRQASARRRPQRHETPRQAARREI